MSNNFRRLWMQLYRNNVKRLSSSKKFSIFRKYFFRAKNEAAQEAKSAEAAKDFQDIEAAKNVYVPPWKRMDSHVKTVVESKDFLEKKTVSELKSVQTVSAVKAAILVEANHKDIPVTNNKYIFPSKRGNNFKNG